MENSQIVVVKSVSQLRGQVAAMRQAGKTIGLVPTMGALHEGHLSLARESKNRCDLTVTTIFVNPTQFAADEDLDRYPRNLDADCAMLQDSGVDIIFVPETEDIYPRGWSTAVKPPAVAELLEGEFRPTHFAGVCTVVLKLLNIVNPDLAFFGQKDYQQVCVIRRMAVDLNVPVEIAICPIVRADDGLALSSRNRYLDGQQRQTALSLNQTLRFVAARIRAGQTDAHELMAEMSQRLIDAGVTRVDYAVIANPHTLQTVDTIHAPVVALIAAQVGETRLIDNRVIE